MKRNASVKIHGEKRKNQKKKLKKSKKKKKNKKKKKHVKNQKGAQRCGQCALQHAPQIFASFQMELVAPTISTKGNGAQRCGGACEMSTLLLAFRLELIRRSHYAIATRLYFFE